MISIKHDVVLSHTNLILVFVQHQHTGIYNHKITIVLLRVIILSAISLDAPSILHNKSQNHNPYSDVFSDQGATGSNYITLSHNSF